MLVQHSSKKNDWGTPDEVLDLVRKLFPRIALDTASSAEHNLRVRADRFYSEGGLEKPWDAETVFCNPPGGKLKGKSLQALFWKKCVEEYQAGHFRQAVFLGFSIELLRTSQQSYPMGAFPHCIPSKRLPFIGPGDSPAHANVLAFVGRREWDFYDLFSTLGHVVIP
jgi:hypothetical protein